LRDKHIFDLIRIEKKRSHWVRINLGEQLLEPGCLYCATGKRKTQLSIAIELKTE